MDQDVRRAQIYNKILAQLPNKKYVGVWSEGKNWVIETVIVDSDGEYFYKESPDNVAPGDYAGFDGGSKCQIFDSEEALLKAAKEEYKVPKDAVLRAMLVQSWVEY